MKSFIFLKKYIANVTFKLFGKYYFSLLFYNVIKKVDIRKKEDTVKRFCGKRREEKSKQCCRNDICR